MGAVLAIVMCFALFSYRLMRNTLQSKVTRVGSDDFRDNTNNKQVFYARCGCAAVVVCALCAGGAYAIHKMKQPKSIPHYTERDPFLLWGPRCVPANCPDTKLAAAFKECRMSAFAVLAELVLRGASQADIDSLRVSSDEES